MIGKCLWPLFIWATYNYQAVLLCTFFHKLPSLQRPFICMKESFFFLWTIHYFKSFQYVSKATIQGPIERPMAAAFKITYFVTLQLLYQYDRRLPIPVVLDVINIYTGLKVIFRCSRKATTKVTKRLLAYSTELEVSNLVNR